MKIAPIFATNSNKNKVSFQGFNCQDTALMDIKTWDKTTKLISKKYGVPIEALKSNVTSMLGNLNKLKEFFGKNELIDLTVLGLRSIKDIPESTHINIVLQPNSKIFEQAKCSVDDTYAIDFSVLQSKSNFADEFIKIAGKIEENIKTKLVA